MVMDFLAGVILYLAPMYFANSSAMLLGGKTPLDLGKKFPDGRPIFGKGKTFKGFFFGTLIGTLAAFVINLLFEAQVASLLPDYMLLGFLLSLGAILGDMAGSFLKRRIGMAPGKPAFFLDQLDFVAGGILLGLPVYVPGIAQIAVMAAVTLVVHRLSNYFAYKINLKKVPW
ncbi:MAG TPA: CDP-2,3-bis-(O-geranylgeranyl)-sn-glycerol synthase [archaeon]|nr:CDP-2,3-bis-(O-geranylgeranyl)-sn-glycerol synthase [archaeon]